MHTILAHFYFYFKIKEWFDILGNMLNRSLEKTQRVNYNVLISEL